MCCAMSGNIDSLKTAHCTCLPEGSCPIGNNSCCSCSGWATTNLLSQLLYLQTRMNWFWGTMEPRAPESPRVFPLIPSAIGKIPSRQKDERQLLPPACLCIKLTPMSIPPYICLLMSHVVHTLYCCYTRFAW